VEDVNILIESGIMHKEDYIGGVLVKEPAITAASIRTYERLFEAPCICPGAFKDGIDSPEGIEAL
jgi:hypothetical protein